MVWFDSVNAAVANDAMIPEGYAGPIISMDEWAPYAQSRYGVDWEISGGNFVKLHSPEFMRGRIEAEERILTLKHYLTSTDYQSIKFSEGAITVQEWTPVKEARAEARAEINRLEEQYEL